MRKLQIPKTTLKCRARHLELILFTRLPKKHDIKKAPVFANSKWLIGIIGLFGGLLPFPVPGVYNFRLYLLT